jgi:virulence-associated protein VapD
MVFKDFKIFYWIRNGSIVLYYPDQLLQIYQDITHKLYTMGFAHTSIYL